MFHKCEDFDIKNYSDDTAPSACAPDTVISKLRYTSDKLFNLVEK